MVDNRGNIVCSLQTDTGFDPMAEAGRLIKGVDSLIAKGQGPREIARGLHTSIIRRVVGMISRVVLDGNVVFTGGVAKNPCMCALLEQKLGCKILVSDDPQCVGALGAALPAVELG